MKHEESLNQQALIKWFQLQHKDKVLFSIPNGAHLGKRGFIQARRLKAEGLMPGVSDLFLMESRGIFHGLFIEMKSAKKKPTLDQRIFQDKAMERGYLCQVCNSFESATKTIEDYLAL